MSDRPMIACIRSDDNERRSLCRRDIAWDEHTFVDADHAVKHYADLKYGLKACPNCVAIYRLIQEMQSRSYGT